MAPYTFWQVLKLLYGIAEVGSHWFSTYRRHHIEKLEMSPLTYDPCLLYSTKDFLEVLGMQIDDTLFLADKTFAEKKIKELKNDNFVAKHREQLTTNTPLKLNSVIAAIA